MNYYYYLTNSILIDFLIFMNEAMDGDYHILVNLGSETDTVASGCQSTPLCPE